MTLGEKLKKYRSSKGLSQEKVAELLDVSRQAVTKWENNQTTPSVDNLIALSSLYDVPLEELAGTKNKTSPKENIILRTNLTLIAIILQAAALNACVQPLSIEGKEYVSVFMFIKLTFLFLFSAWMAWNLRYEKDKEQLRKNAKTELLYCTVMAAVALFVFYSKLYFVGTLIFIAVCLFYIFVINPKYMNRTLVKRKSRKKQ